jgi:hypothetical protein
MTDLRNHLFEVMEALKDKDNPMEVARAKAVVDAAQALINTAKVEVQYLEAVDASESTGFFDTHRDGMRRLEPVAGAGIRRLAS